MSTKIKLTEAARGLRLDKFLGTLDEIKTRSRALNLIQSQAVTVNGKYPKASLILTGTEILEITIPELESSVLMPMEMSLDILFEDESLIVINKPPGLVVHPAAGHAQDTLVNALISHVKDFSMKFGDHRPGIVHRLDKDTSGIMVVAKNDSIQEALSQQFKDRSIQRHYLAIVNGRILEPQGTITSFLARHPVDRKKMASLKDKDRKIIREIKLNPGLGKWSHTDFKVLAHHPSGITYLKLKLQTGRTHQIRVHLSEKGFPLLGDPIYGNSNDKRKVPRLALHAAELGFTHPNSGEQLHFTSFWPNDFKSIVENLFGDLS